ncbi:glycosyltransferase [Daejeonella sp.]|jgi:glycosyltransferase involved in cell wall biosynthesis|uniref:glycosyltransferase n=1 Tax=Daejeonella sp. TaxID=2805397 RepID=UPI0037BF1893
MNNYENMVSICCITYNQEKYIAEALDGFLMQNTNFNYEIIIGDDCSTDATRSIIEDYSERYPGKIQLLTNLKNGGATPNILKTLGTAQGKYIAMCDGDDYWTDSRKLQMQVDFMENNPDSSICCHYSSVIDENGDLVYEDNNPVSLEYTYEDVLLGRKNETRVCTMMMKNNDHLKHIKSQEWFYQVYSADTFFKLYVLSEPKAKLYVLPEIMAVYRLHQAGVWSMIDSQVRKKKMIDDFNILINNFSYTAQHKKELLKIYLMQYFLFDVKNFKFQKAINTLITLV